MWFHAHSKTVILSLLMNVQRLVLVPWLTEIMALCNKKLHSWLYHLLIWFSYHVTKTSSDGTILYIYCDISQWCYPSYHCLSLHAYIWYNHWNIKCITEKPHIIPSHYIKYCSWYHPVLITKRVRCPLTFKIQIDLHGISKCVKLQTPHQ